MDYYSNQISKLIDELSRLPGIGAKSASRLAFHLIHMPKEEVKRLADTMVEARENVRYCKECCTLTDQELCPICSNLNRDHKTIMVVENTRDLAAYERKIQRRLPCTSRRNLPDAWHRSGRHQAERTDPAPGRRCRRSHHCDKFKPGRRDDRDVYQQADKTHRSQSQPHCQRRAGRRRSGVY